MRLSEFDFSFPRERIARYPSPIRGGSRLLIAHRENREIVHTTFSNICDFLEKGDALVVNQSRVFPARLIGEKESGGRIELLLLKNLSGGQLDSRFRGNDRWRCLAFPLKRLKPSYKMYFPSHSEARSQAKRSAEESPTGFLALRARNDSPVVTAKVLEVETDESVIVDFQVDGDFQSLLEKIGHVPLPPYLGREDEPVDHERYQTVFAKENGSSAAPTAGLHWTEELLEEARAKGVKVVPITLHVGRGTFSPIREDNIEKHKMHSEYVEISEEAAQSINNAKRVIAVGTTVVRALESSARDGKVTATSGTTDLYIYPGYRFQIVDALQTNFHQPKSSLLVMVSAFAGIDFIRHCYEEAIKQRYQLFSYGDTMLILY